MTDPIAFIGGTDPVAKNKYLTQVLANLAPFTRKNADPIVAWEKLRLTPCTREKTDPNRSIGETDAFI